MLAQRAQFCNAPLDVSPVLLADRDHTGARPATAAEREDFANLVQREAEALRAFDERKLPDHALGVLAVARGRPGRRGNQPLALVEPDGASRNPRPSRNFSK